MSLLYECDGHCPYSSSISTLLHGPIQNLSSLIKFPLHRSKKMLQFNGCRCRVVPKYQESIKNDKYPVSSDK